MHKLTNWFTFLYIWFHLTENPIAERNLIELQLCAHLFFSRSTNLSPQYLLCFKYRVIHESCLFKAIRLKILSTIFVVLKKNYLTWHCSINSKFQGCTMDSVDGRHSTDLVILCIVIGCTISLSAHLVLFRPGTHLDQPGPLLRQRGGKGRIFVTVKWKAIRA